MESFRRLWPFIRPYRGRLTISILFGFLVAGLWGANLTAIFPIVKVLLEQKSLNEYVADEIARAEQDVTFRRESLVRVEERLAVLEAERPEDDAERVELLRSRVENEEKLSASSGKLLTMKRVELHVLPWIPNNQFKAFALILCVLLVAELLKGICVFAQDILIGSVVQRVIMSIRTKCLDNVLALDYQTLSQDGTGGLMSRFTYDTEQVAQGIMLIGARLIREPLKAAACMGLAFWINWRLTLLSLAFLPLLGLFLHWYGKTLKRASRRMMDSMSRIYRVLEETLEGLKIVIAFGTSDRHRRQFHHENDQFYGKAMRVVRVDAIAKPTMEILGLLAMFLAMLPGAYLVLQKKSGIWGIRLSADVMTAAQLCALYALLVGMLDPCRKMSAIFSRIKRCSAALDRIFELMDRPPHVTECLDAQPFHGLAESIEFRDVMFQYPGRENGPLRGPALNKLNLSVRKGEVVAIVGPNGCGKSTLVSMLPRLYDATAGQLLIDGIPIAELRIDELRAQIGLVAQDTMLFDDTIEENIRYGRPDAATSDVEQAAQQAHVMEIVDNLPDGFATMVGEKGKELSGGQRQRIALARSIVRDPSILILDEATSASDAHSELLILEALKAFVPGRTVFIITHSMTPAILDLVDRIVVMHEGSVIADGTHHELLQSCSLYATLYHANASAQAA